MSDLEQSDLENISDDEVSIASQEDTQPTFTTKKIPQTLKVKNFDEEGNVIGDDFDDEEELDQGEGEGEGEGEGDSEIDEDQDDFSVDEEGNIEEPSTIEKVVNKSSNKIEELPTTTISLPNNIDKNDSDYDSDDDEEEDDEYLQKFDKEMRENYIQEQHPESMVHNYEEIYNLAKVVRNKDNIVIDELHKTIPMLTKYEKTRVLGIRAKQINNGAKPMTSVPDNVMDGYLIALKELEEKKIPVIIRRPIPNGSSEYWHLKDLEII